MKRDPSFFSLACFPSSIEDCGEAKCRPQSSPELRLKDESSTSVGMCPDMQYSGKPWPWLYISCDRSTGGDDMALASWSQNLSQGKIVCTDSKVCGNKSLDLASLVNCTSQNIETEDWMRSEFPVQQYKLELYGLPGPEDPDLSEHLATSLSSESIDCDPEIKSPYGGRLRHALHYYAFHEKIDYARPSSSLSRWAAESAIASCVPPTVTHGLRGWDAWVALQTAQEVASYLNRLHSAGLIHGDVTMDNVHLLSSNKDRRGFEAQLNVPQFFCSQCQISSGEPKLVSDHCSATLAGMTTAPEGGEPTMASDIFQLGVMLWELFVAEDYHSDVGAEVACLMAAGGTVPMPREAPQHYRCLVNACMSSKPHLRPSASDVLTELRDIQSKMTGLLGADSPCRVLTSSLFDLRTDCVVQQDPNDPWDAAPDHLADGRGGVQDLSQSLTDVASYTPVQLAVQLASVSAADAANKAPGHIDDMECDPAAAELESGAGCLPAHMRTLPSSQSDADSGSGLGIEVTLHNTLLLECKSDLIILPSNIIDDTSFSAFSNTSEPSSMDPSSTEPKSADPSSADTLRLASAVPSQEVLETSSKCSGEAYFELAPSSNASSELGVLDLVWAASSKADISELLVLLKAFGMLSY